MFVRKGMGQIADASKCTTFLGWTTNTDCWGHSIPYWQGVATPGSGALAPPLAPTGSVLTTPPASGADAQATVNQLLNEQMAAQQAVDAAKVQPVTDIYSIINSLTGGAFAGSSSPTDSTGIPWWAWVAGGSILLVAAFGGRR